MLELCDGKLSRTVLKGEWGCEAPDLLDARAENGLIMKSSIYMISLAFLGIISALTLYGAVYTFANHYFYFAPNKIAVEFETSMIFAGGYLLIAVAAAIFLIALRKYKNREIA